MHLALTNDEGWQLEIPGLDELTSVGLKRCFGERSVSTLTFYIRLASTFNSQYGFIFLSVDLTEEKCLLTQLGSGPYAEGQQYYT